jgi:SAM-dependent methyltransferase
MKRDTAETYNEHFRTNPERWAEPQEVDYLIKKILDEEYSEDFASIVDLGCGQGRTISVIKKPEWFLYGVDWSVEALRIAKENNPEDYLNFGKYEMQQVGDFLDGHLWNCALSVGSHEHIYEISFQQVYKLLSSVFGGLFLCVLPTFPETIGWQQTGPQWEWKLTRDEWMRHLEGDGFKVDTNILHKDLFVCRKQKITTT